jgi:hypothetical protein
VLSRVWLYKLLASLLSRLCVGARACGWAIGTEEVCAGSEA